ncbi:hypothetical protein [Marinobacterium marinum]|uniref:Uncharacterized protein n=1 Tax=Marinobacterium marinum TaxID=2756129 RepID=A0A7W1WY63_9GAMM|nr:hypothetical protein [Marinobacterium marinum]MBA4502400.1 hypothetical protein [Marinobacterium marinum]
MPSRSTQENISSACCQALVGLLGLSLSTALMAVELIPYAVTGVDRFSSGRAHGRELYQDWHRGDRDWEPLREVAFADYQRVPPSVQVVYPSPEPEVQRVVVRPEPVVALFGEDKVFDRIRLDLDIQRCVFQNICTEEVKALPGMYLGDRQPGDSGWQGRADEPPMATAPEPAARAPGRVFVEEPVETP